MAATPISPISQAEINRAVWKDPCRQPCTPKLGEILITQPDDNNQTIPVLAIYSLNPFEF